MKNILALISSTRLMAILLFAFGVAIASATFIENDFGTEGARDLVYDAKWFEILLILGCINIVAVIISAKLYKREKISIFIFHISFLVIILGAGVTRYFGHEGNIRIREGETTDRWISTETYIQLYASDQGATLQKSYPVLFSAVGRNKFRRSVNLGDQSISIKLIDYLPSAQKKLRFSDEGEPIVHLVTSSGVGREELFITPGQRFQTKSGILSFDVNYDSIPPNEGVKVFINQGMLYFISSVDATRMAMADQAREVLKAGRVYPFTPLMLYDFEGTPFVLRQFMPQGKLDAEPLLEGSEPGISALRFEVNNNGIRKELVTFGQANAEGRYNMIKINGVDIGLGYGSVVRKLPFKLRLNDFVLKRYPGSDSPSWYESNVQLIDEEKAKNEQVRVYMNNILKHRGYRFYQSSYDSDELGTVLSINRDGLGTSITYLGYLLMTIGMAFSLFNRKSRFQKLVTAGSVTSTLAKGVITLLIFSGTSFSAAKAAAVDSLPVLPIEQATSFGKILVQDNGGRIEPINTLASEILRKVARKEEYKGQNPEQVLLGMLVYPEIWQQEPMIRVNHPEIQEILNISSKQASFIDFFSSSQYRGYALKEFVEQAHRKKPAYRSKFDNELIRVDERLNIAYLAYTGALFRVFPDPNDTTYTWHSPLSGGSVFSGKDSVFVTHIFSYYAEEAAMALKSGDWHNPSEMLKGIKIFQANYGEEVLPSPGKVKAEIFYNNANLFERIKSFYYLFGILLLIIQFINIFSPSFSIRKISLIFFILIAIVFLGHSTALILRWYIAGHAPWSNGYEALTFIAWSAVLAGLIFYNKSGISLSVTALLAGLILQTAHLTFMDPQVTNLVPVLQSYWLVIHVAIITNSYSFLGLGAFVAIVNLLLLFFQNSKNYQRFEEQIAQLTLVIEMSLTVGIYLLAIGTFLGGVWANESWGRYWAWDPKETWALVTIIVYAVILHMRIVPGLKGRVLFNITALVGFGSVIMTYFGVNYYLSGLHSYAQGDPLPIPPIVYYSVASVIVLSLLAVINQSTLKKKIEHANE